MTPPTDKNRPTSGLAWHTTDETLREGFSQFGAIEEAVRIVPGAPASCRPTPLFLRMSQYSHMSGRCQGP